MKKVISVLSSVIIAASTGLVATKTLSKSENIKVEKSVDFTKINDDLLKNNIDVLSSISNKEIKKYLYEMNGNVYFKEELITNFNFTEEFKSVLQNKVFEKTTIQSLEFLGMFSERGYGWNLKSGIFGNGYQVAWTGPETWYEWIILVNRLHVNNAGVEGIIIGSWNVQEFADAVREMLEAGGQIPGMPAIAYMISLIVSAVTGVSAIVLEGINKGNGVYWRFFINGISASSYNW